jgi:ATP-dependent RNA helicase RhlE
MEPMKQFSELNLNPNIQQALQEAGYQTPTAIQQQAIPLILEGHDLLGIAQTGTGKTAAFCLPILNILSTRQTRPEPRCPRVLVLTPTRELAIQIHQSLLTYGRYLKQKYVVIFGGVGQGKQVRDLHQGPDVLVATPGRLLDLIQQNHLRLSKVEVFVLDEADRMLDMGFMRDIKRILPMLPAKRHNLFFSATMPNEIQVLANTILRNPKKVEVTPPATTVKLIEQSVMYVTKADKLDLLVHLLQKQDFVKTLVFVEMKHIADRVTEKLLSSGVSAVAIHGNKSQGARQRAIQDFTEGKAKVLVATDIASRGIDIDGITHVVNYELSNIAESYVHRIGRTARAGAAGAAVSLVTGDEKSYLANIERTTKHLITVNADQPYHSDIAFRAQITSVGKAKAKIEGQRKTRTSRPQQRPMGRRAPAQNANRGFSQQR